MVQFMEGKIRKLTLDMTGMELVQKSGTLSWDM